MTTTTRPKGCTIRFATTGLCGAPPIVYFTGRTGTVYAECAEHAAEYLPAGATATLVVGARVRVVHCGIPKVGTVTTVARTRVTVEVPVGYGTKFIHRPIAEIEVIA